MLSVILERVHDAVHPVCGAGESNPDALIRLEQLRRAMGPSHLGMVDDFLTVGIDPNAASDLFSILANRDHRLPTIIVSQSGPAYWVEALREK